jgi:hypothetical protein
VRRLIALWVSCWVIGADMTFRCGAGGNIPAEGVIELKAGDKVFVQAHQSLFTPLEALFRLDLKH